MPVALAPGSSSSLPSILQQSFGRVPTQWSGGWIAYYPISQLTAWDFRYWNPASPSVGTWFVNGTDIGGGFANQTFEATNNFGAVTFQAGNDMGPLAYFTVPESASSYIQYSVITVDPSLMGADAGLGEPSASDIVAAAHRFNSFYGFVPNDNDCHYIAADLAAAAGATLPDATQSLNPADNQEGGFWRIVYRGSDPNPVTDWQSLVRPGDIVRMGWSGGGQHTTTVLAVNADGSMVVYDNADYLNGVEGIGIHTVQYDLQTIPADTTIYRLTTDGLYLETGDGYDDQIAGTIFNDHILGGAGNDTLVGSAGSDTLDGGAGINTVDYSNYGAAISVDVANASGLVTKAGGGGIDTLVSIENITGTAYSDVFYVDSAESVTGGGGFDYLIELSAGVNLAYGTNFTGITEFVSNTGANTVSFALDANFAYMYGSTGNDTLTLGSGGGYLIGEGGTNVLTGGADATNLFEGGSGGTDTMNGGTGTASNFYFVDGNDQVNGAGAFNTMIELVTGVTVQLGSAQYQDVQEFVANSGTNAVTVANTDSDFSYLYGGAGNDTLTTGSGGGYLFGEGGTNLLTGGGGLNVFVADGASGVDTMNGGSGSNIYYIDNDSIVHGAGTFNTVIELQQNVSLTLGSAQLGTDVQQVILNGGTNTVDFSSATSSVFLYGGSGNDTLFGGTGNDFLYGGAGTNTFKFATGWGHDTIEDWTAGTNDQIDLTALAAQGVHALTDLTQTITAGHDVITSSDTGTNSIALLGVGSALTASSFHFA